MSQRIDFAIEERGNVLANCAHNKLDVVYEHIGELDPDLLGQGIARPTKCFIIVEPRPTMPEATSDQLLAALDQRILDLEYQNLMLQEGLT